MKDSPFWEKTEIKRDKLFIRIIIILALFLVFTPLAYVQFLCFFFIFIITGSRIYTERLVRNIRINRMDFELRVFRHEWVQIEIKIENRGLLPAFMLVAGDLQGDLQVARIRKTFFTLFRHSWTLLRWDGLCAERGVFNTGPAVIHGADPLGLFPFRLTAKEKTKIFVYPSIRSVLLNNGRGVPLGNIVCRNPLFEDITRYKSLRPYYPSDERRRINWKASAHASGLLVNEYDAAASFPLMVFLNADRDEYPRKNRSAMIERTIEAAAALCLKAFRERQAAGIIIHTSGAEDFFLTPAFFSLVPVLERLAALDWKRKNNSPEAGEETSSHNSMMSMLNHGKNLPYGTRYIYTGPDPGSEAYINLNYLKKHHLFLEYLIIDEKTLPPVVPGNSRCYQIKESGYEII
ncbi:MAG: DUF58 domain-containing protein [Treponema sp.]|nr:DUF58 domain-containing protein [Treponema sp.]MCL2271789.1 DUF58 domain-containing protein [Treponema sp.]